MRQRLKKTSDDVPSQRHSLIPRSIVIDGDEWNAVGSGIRFAVYARGTEVIKVPLSAAQILEVWMLSCQTTSNTTAQMARRCYISNMKDIADVRDRLMSGKLPPHLFGCLRIEQNGWIYQERMTPLIDLLRVSDTTVQSTLVDEAVASMAELVRWGAIASYFSVPVDFGLSLNGHVAVMGLGGLRFDQKALSLILTAKPWRSAISGIHMLPKSLRPYFVAQIEHHFTDECLADQWGKARGTKNGAEANPDDADEA